MTYSIVAYDPETKHLGVAVQTHQPSVGAVVPWVKAGVGAIATQSLTNISFGPLGLELMQGGVSAEKALAALLASDPAADQRQVSLIDKDGKVATHTGDHCIPFAGHHIGKNYSVQANMMLKDTVPAAMAKAFEGAQGDLMQRMMIAMEAAEGEGGDIRGSQSAAMHVYSSEKKPHWENRLCDLRVDENPDPIAELRRLVDLRTADQLSREGFKQAEDGNLKDALITLANARKLSSDPTEMIFWQALTLADNHELIEEARALLKPLFADEPQWKELIPRLVPAGLLDHPEIVEKLLAD
jgi:uncharacterized Ntn-hydrolase superfamily protein